MPSRHDIAREALRRAEEEAGLRAGGSEAGPHEGASESRAADEVRQSTAARRWSEHAPPAVDASDTHAPPPERDWPDRQAPTPDPEDDPTTRGDDADPEAVARQIVLRQLAMAPRSRKQLEDKLRQKGCDDDVAARVLDRMTEVGLVDDVAYAEMLVRSKQASSGLAAPRLRQELRKKGVDLEIIDDAVADISPEAERAVAEELAAKKIRTMHGLPTDTQARRLAGYLARKGYSSSIVYDVVRWAVTEADEHQRD